MDRLVVDASVVVKWYLADEELQGEAVEILHSHAQGTLQLVAPSLLPYELLNALRVAERVGRINSPITQDSFQAFVDLDLALVDPFAHFTQVLTLAREHTISIYDASYLCIAKVLGTNLVTADERLYNSARNLNWVIWLGEYSM